MMRWIRFVPMVLPVILLSTTTGAALAQAWPSAKPLRLMVTQAAGSATDTVARYYADRLGKAIGQQIAVENRPGGANIPGLQAAARAAPDGYNFLIGTSVSFTTNVYLFKSLPYDPANDFVPLAMLTRPSFTVAVNAKPGWLMSIGRWPTPPDRSRGASRSTIDSKSSRAPVRNDQW